jgi:hypothetical protein
LSTIGWGGNTANGAGALILNETGDGNTANGYITLILNETGSYNTAVGYEANVSTYDISNATAIGAEAYVTSSNQVVIGNESVTSIGGYAPWSNFADERAKKNIRADVPGLDFINRLQPITYNLDLDAIDDLRQVNKTRKQIEDKLPQRMKDKYKKAQDKAKEAGKKAREAKEKQVQTGFLAQGVEEAAKSIGYNFSGVDVDETGVYGLRYAEFVVPLVKAVQELGEQNDKLQAQVNELTELVYALQGKDADPSASLLKSKSFGESGTGLQELANNGASLQQNIPNPFSQSTVIRYTLPQTCTSAQLVVTATSGQAVRQIPLSCSGGAGSVAIEGGALSAGSYFYSLYVDNKLVDTKQMILTK